MVVPSTVPYTSKSSKIEVLFFFCVQGIKCTTQRHLRVWASEPQYDTSPTLNHDVDASQLYCCFYPARVSWPLNQPHIFFALTAKTTHVHFTRFRYVLHCRRNHHGTRTSMSCTTRLIFPDRRQPRTCSLVTTHTSLGIQVVDSNWMMTVFSARKQPVAAVSRACQTSYVLQAICPAVTAC